jgi:hypothetical protein
VGTARHFHWSVDHRSHAMVSPDLYCWSTESCMVVKLNIKHWCVNNRQGKCDLVISGISSRSIHRSFYLIKCNTTSTADKTHGVWE